MKRIRWTVLTLAIVMLLSCLAACNTPDNKEPNTEGTTTADKANGEKTTGDNKKYKIVMVAKHEGIPWFDDMRLGVEKFAKDHDDVEAWQIAPEGGDPAKQVSMVEDMIAQGVDAILVVPNDPNAMRPILERAKSEGIVVISHEAAGLADVVDYDLEAFKNDEFGRLMFEELAKAMGGKGEYAMMVGGLTMETHMDWMKAGMEYVKENYPDMKAVTEQPFEDKNDDKIARDKAIEILNAYPNLKGFVSASVSGGSNMASVLKERENHDVVVSSLGIPSVSGPYLEEGYMAHAQTWRPADAGYASAMLAYKLLKGEKVEDGIDLGAEGYGSVVIEDKIVYGNAPLILKKGTFKPDEYPF